MNRAALAAALVVGLGAWSLTGRARASSSIPGAVGLIYSAEDLIEDAMGSIAPGAWTPPARAQPYLALIEQAELRHGIPRDMIARLLYQESRFRPEIIDGTVQSPAGALGIAQFMPATAAELGVNPLDPASAIDGAARYLAQLYRSTGDWSLALAAYNWGIGNVTRKGIEAAPAETREYVAGIMGDLGLA